MVTLAEKQPLVEMQTKKKSCIPQSHTIHTQTYIFNEGD